MTPPSPPPALVRIAYIHYVVVAVRIVYMYHAVKYTRLCDILLLLMIYVYYGVATISRMLKNIGLFCKRDLQKRPIFCKETNIFKHPTNRSHPIYVHYAVAYMRLLLHARTQKRPTKQTYNRDQFDILLLLMMYIYYAVEYMRLYITLLLCARSL